MNDREKYEFELLENRVYKLERLLLADNKLEVNITSGTLDKDYIDSDIARDTELVDTTESAEPPEGGKNGDVWRWEVNGNIYMKIAGTWRQVS